MSLSSYIKNKRMEHDLTQAKLANHLEITTTAVKLIEYGHTKYPSKKVLNNLAKLFETTPIDVMYDIIFEDCKVAKDSGQYLVNRYVIQMYLEGWNITDCPLIIPENYGNAKNVFGARLVKKREPKNIVIVCSYRDNFIRLNSVDNENDAFAYLGDIASKLMKIEERIRSVHIVFDADNEKEVSAYNQFISMKKKSVWFDFKMMLFGTKQNNKGVE